jgi:hypothetical protein
MALKARRALLVGLREIDWVGLGGIQTDSCTLMRKGAIYWQNNDLRSP